jgi:hypothetical protein
LPPTAGASFQTQPLYFGQGCDIYLPIITDLGTLQRERGVQLAKELLDSIAEFESIINARVFKYTVTRYSLYIAYKRGFRAAEILRLLRTLSQNPMPDTLYQLIANEEAYRHYYRAVLVLRDGKYYVQSRDKKVITTLLSDPHVSKLAVHPDHILLVTIVRSTSTSTSTSTSSLSSATFSLHNTYNQHTEVAENHNQQEGSGSEKEEQRGRRESDEEEDIRTSSSPPHQYAFEVIPNSSEAIKKYCFQAGYPLIDEYDFAADNSLNIK